MRIAIILFLASFLRLSGTLYAQVPGVEHVVIVGCDGLTPRGIQAAKTPNIDELMRCGAFTLHAQAVKPSVSLPNWASLFMGATPKQHGIKSNSWKPSPPFDPACDGIRGIFPTIYEVLMVQRPDLIRAFFHDWEGIAQFAEGSAPDEIRDCKNEDKTVRCAVEYFKKRKPNLTFIYLDHVDHAGHSDGYESKKYDRAVEKADRLIGEILTGLKMAGMFEKTAILLTSDHGGIHRKHGGEKAVELEIPWILFGAGVAQGKELTTPVNIYDTAATIAYIFGATPHPCWTGKPVLEAFIP